MFADCLRLLREKAGISQYRLAKQSGISKQMLSRLELNESQPSWETVQRLAKALGVDCRAFVDPNLDMPPPLGPARRRGRPSQRSTSATAAQKQGPTNQPARRK